MLLRIKINKLTKQKERIKQVQTVTFRIFGSLMEFPFSCSIFLSFILYIYHSFCININFISMDFHGLLYG